MCLLLTNTHANRDILVKEVNDAQERLTLIANNPTDGESVLGTYYCWLLAILATY
jgi:hypothetical protein